MKRLLAAIQIVIPITRVLLFIFIASIAVTSCKKNVAAPEPIKEGLGTMSAVIDGKACSFNYGTDPNTTAKARLGTSYPNLYELVVVGQKATGWFEDGLSVTIDSPDPITTGTYIFNNASNMRIAIWYCPARIPLEPCRVSGNSGIVTITEINSSYVKGSFSATLSYIDNSGVARTNIVTNGKFNAPF